MNNYLENLEYCTHQENMDDQIAHGTRIFGERQGLSKLSERQVLNIRYAKKCKKAVAREYGVHLSTVKDIQNRKTWKHLK